jgi:hypothetical protein
MRKNWWDKLDREKWAPPMWPMRTCWLRMWRWEVVINYLHCKPAENQRAAAVGQAAPIWDHVYLLNMAHGRSGRITYIGRGGGDKLPCRPHSVYEYPLQVPHGRGGGDQPPVYGARVTLKGALVINSRVPSERVTLKAAVVMSSPMGPTWAIPWRMRHTSPLTSSGNLSLPKSLKNAEDRNVCTAHKI